MLVLQKKRESEREKKHVHDNLTIFFKVDIRTQHTHT